MEAKNGHFVNFVQKRGWCLANLFRVSLYSEKVFRFLGQNDIL